MPCVTRVLAVTLSMTLTVGAVGSTSPTAPRTRAVTPTALVENVRRSIRYDAIRRLKHGFTVKEVPHDSIRADGFVYVFGSNGKVRREGTGPNRNPFVFDGEDGWSVDPRIGMPVPNTRSGREKLLFPAWIRSGWWLDERARLETSIVDSASNADTVALAMRFEGGNVGAMLFVDRQTWLPAKLVVEYSAGPYTLELSDYVETLGFLHPRRLKTNYRNADAEYRVASIVANAAGEKDSFLGNVPSGDATFDEAVAATLKVTQGEGEEGHSFVWPSIDGHDVGPFHFDSGYFGLTIDTRIADELGLPVLRTTTIVGNDGESQAATVRKAKTFRLGRLILRDPVLMATDLSGRSAPPGLKRAGICGYPVFARSVVELGRGGERISLHDPATYRLRKGRWRKLHYAGHAAGVDARFEGNRRGFFMLDTGASMTVFFNSGYSRQQGLLAGRKTTPLVGEGSGGGTLSTLQGQLRWFEFGGKRFSNPTVEFSIEGEGVEEEDIAGIIGRAFMKGFQAIVFDYPTKRIAFVE